MTDAAATTPDTAFASCPFAIIPAQSHEMHAPDQEPTRNSGKEDACVDFGGATKRRRRAEDSER